MKLHQASFTFLKVYWKRAPPDNGAILFYLIKWQYEDAKGANKTFQHVHNDTKLSNYTIDKLPQYTNVSVRIAVGTAAGVSSASDHAFFMTKTREHACITCCVPVRRMRFDFQYPSNHRRP